MGDSEMQELKLYAVLGNEATAGEKMRVLSVFRNREQAQSALETFEQLGFYARIVVFVPEAP